MSPSYLRAVVQAVLVTFLWATSWVLITIGLEDVPPLVFAGLRYGLAAALLGAWALSNRRVRRQLRTAGRRTWWSLVGLGVVMYALTQGAQFVALSLLPAATVSLVLSLTPVVVALGAATTLGEPVRALTGVGLGVALAGSVTYLIAGGGVTGSRAGLVVAGVGVVSNAAAALLGRAVNHRSGLSPLAVTSVSMTVGAVVLLAVGLPVEGLPELTGRSWAVVAWLAVVNTAVAFTLWNHALRTLTAAAASAVNNTMLVQVAVLAWVVLGQQLSPLESAGVLVVTLGTTLVQLGSRPRPAPAPHPAEQAVVRRSRPTTPD